MNEDGSGDNHEQSNVSSSIISQASPGQSICWEILIGVVHPLSVVPTSSPGIADIVGFGVNGVVIWRHSTGRSLQVIHNFGYDAGDWRVDKHARLLGVTTCDGGADVIGFGNSGVWISINNGNNTFRAPRLAIYDFAYANGWRNDKHLRFVADIRKTGYVDIVGFGEAGILVALNNGHGQFGNIQVALTDFGCRSGWRLDRHLRFLADTTGDRLPDVVGFGEKSVFVSRNNGDGTFQPARPVISTFCIGAGGWKMDKHPRILADLTGDGKVDILGFGEAGVWVSLNNGQGSFEPNRMVIKKFSFAQGWRVDKHPRFVADLTGNKCGDIIGFGDAGVWVSLNNGDGTFQAPKLVVSDFGYSAGGWRMEKHLRFVADLTGNGCADIIGFGEAAVWVSYNDGTGSFGPVLKLTDALGFNDGTWAMDKTVRYVANLST